MQNSFTSALGGHAGPDAKPSVRTADGRVWRFTLDVPQLVANCEQLAEEEGREALRQGVAALGEGNDELKMQLVRDEGARRRDGYYAAGGEGHVALFGDGGNRKPTKKGNLLFVLAAARIEHPDCTIADVNRMMLDDTAGFLSILESLGKELAARAPELIARVKAAASPTPSSSSPASS